MTDKPSIENLRDAVGRVEIPEDQYALHRALDELERLREADANAVELARDDAETIQGLRAENKALRAQVVAGVYDAALVGITLIKTAKLEEERARFDAERARADELAKRVEVLTDLALGRGPTHIYEGSCPDADDADVRDPDCFACTVLSYTPAANLSAHDARVRREAWERADAILCNEPDYGYFEAQMKAAILGEAWNAGVEDE